MFFILIWKSYKQAQIIILRQKCITVIKRWTSKVLSEVDWWIFLKVVLQISPTTTPPAPKLRIHSSIHIHRLLMFFYFNLKILQTSTNILSTTELPTSSWLMDCFLIVLKITSTTKPPAPKLRIRSSIHIFVPVTACW